MHEISLESARPDSAEVGLLLKLRALSLTIRLPWVVATVASILLFTMDSKADVSRFTQSLLDYQQSIEDWSRILESRIKAGEPLPELPALEIGPPDNAQPVRHLDYWRKSWNRRNGQSPGPAVREKILQAVQSEPSAIPEVLQTLPQNEHAAVAVARLQSALPQFAFLPMKEIKGIYFTSADMWVDEQEGMIYAAVEGDLLKIPLSFK